MGSAIFPRRQHSASCPHQRVEHRRWLPFLSASIGKLSSNETSNTESCQRSNTRIQDRGVEIENIFSLNTPFLFGTISTVLLAYIRASLTLVHRNTSKICNLDHISSLFCPSLLHSSGIHTEVSGLLCRSENSVLVNTLP